MRSLTTYNSRRPMSLMNQFEQWINELDRDYSADKNSFADFVPAIDLQEKPDAFMVTVDLPGIKREDIKVDFSDNVLTISGERTRETKEGEKYTEKSYGRFMRSFSLPTKVTSEKIDAKFENGVLRLTLPKEPAAKAQSIKIQ